MSNFNYTPECTENCTFTLEPVPGANQWPRRIVCRAHGYPTEAHRRPAFQAVDVDRPNNYLTEIASPADVLERPDGRIESQY